MPIFNATAVSYAKGAERLLGEDADFLNENPDMVPQFVNALFQALEISLKEVGNRSCLTNRNETRGGRSCLIGNGHDIEKLGNLLRYRLGNVSTRRLARVLTDGIENGASAIIEIMIFGEVFAPTRTSYKKRKLVYHAELEEGDIQIVQGVKPWVDAVKAVAENIDNAVALIERWKNSGSTISFDDWYIRENSFLYD
ncbi:hypothetical protein [Desulfosediminicola ganghwensis]|uniref:hypothetical protein n=1 Tax=Desulfosediminicola ganghwensis TaxID=2569540 RepID=UPI0010ACCAC8|nr:hypothetical protein [Desulfosediminicola ganghwensis]